jgi:hypothetical protein
MSKGSTKGKGVGSIGLEFVTSQFEYICIGLDDTPRSKSRLPSHTPRATTPSSFHKLRTPHAYHAHLSHVIFRFHGPRALGAKLA